MRSVGLGVLDHPRELAAQAGAVQMSGEFVARRQIDQPLGFALALGDDAQDSREPFGGAVRARHAHAAHLEDDGAHGRSRLELDLEGGVLQRGVVDDREQSFAAVAGLIQRQKPSPR